MFLNDDKNQYLRMKCLIPFFLMWLKPINFCSRTYLWKRSFIFVRGELFKRSSIFLNTQLILVTLRSMWFKCQNLKRSHRCVFVWPALNIINRHRRSKGHSENKATSRTESLCEYPGSSWFIGGVLIKALKAVILLVLVIVVLIIISYNEC